MKKQLSLILAAALLLTFVACGKSTVPIPNAPFVLGEKYLADLDYEQALLQFDQALVIDPKNPRVYLGKADALLHLSRKEEAVQALSAGAKATSGETRQALSTAQAEVEKSIVDGYIAISSAYETLGWREIALALLQRVCGELPEEGRLREALERLTEARAASTIKVTATGSPTSNPITTTKQRAETIELSGIMYGPIGQLVQRTGCTSSLGENLYVNAAQTITITDTIETSIRAISCSDPQISLYGISIGDSIESARGKIPAGFKEQYFGSNLYDNDRFDSIQINVDSGVVKGFATVIHL